MSVCWTEYPDSSEQREIEDAMNEEDILMDDWDALREVEEDAEAQRRRKELGFFLAGETEDGFPTEDRGTRVGTGYEEAITDGPESSKNQA